MSRCFPYPPPGYVPSIARKGALIESIKLQEERVKFEEQSKKEKRREKKEKKEKKKEKRKHKSEKTNQNHDKPDVVQGHIGKKIMADTKGESLHSENKIETERSNLTEEHGQPVDLQVPSTSSDSTDNSKKRKRDSSLTDARPTVGKILRIKLPPKKPNQSVVASTNQEQHCSTSGRTELPLQNDDIFLRHRTQDLSCRSEVTPIIGQDLALRSNEGQIKPSVALRTNEGQIKPSVAQATLEMPTLTDKMSSRQRKALSKYKNLIEDWVPPQLETILDAVDEDTDWLFKSKKQVVPVEKRQTLGNDALSCSYSSSLWPRVQYLHEVDVFALPYTVPF